MDSAIIIGTGGQARVLVSLLHDLNAFDLKGIVDLDPYDPQEAIMGVPIIGSLSKAEAWRDHGITVAFLAIGDNRRREQVYQGCLNAGFQLPNLISPLATVNPFATLGEANVVCPGAYLGPMSHIGHDNIINTKAIMEHESTIGNHSHLAPGSVVGGRSRLGDRVFLGASATVIDRVSVASGITVGAGGVVCQDLTQPDGTYIGVPVRRIR